MKSNFVDVSIDDLIKFLKQLKEAYPDRVLVTGVTSGGSIHAPSKKRKHFAHKLEHAFAPECFSGNGISALMNGGGFYIAHIPREHINPELLKGDNV